MTFVWIIDEGVRGRVLELAAHYAKVKYSLNGIDYEVLLLNDEYIMMEDMEPQYIGPDDGFGDCMGQDEE